MNKKYETMISNYIEVINKYLSEDSIYDLTLVDHHIKGFTPNEKEALFVAKNYLEKKTFEELCKKACSIEQIKNAEDKMKFKRVLARIAKEIENREANLVDVKVELNMSMPKYLYYIKQLNMFYHKVSKKTLLANNEYYNHVKNYDDIEVEDFHLSDVGKMEDNIIKKIIERNYLKLNQYTYMAAYDYTLRKRFIDLRGNGHEWR